jgi:hypothetical protein
MIMLVRHVVLGKGKDVRILVLVIIVALGGPVPAIAGLEHQSLPVNTYSIVARDPETGQLGVGVQSHWISVGSRALWAEPGIGAVATQSFIGPDYGPLGLQLMRRLLVTRLPASGLLPDGPQLLDRILSVE